MTNDRTNPMTLTPEEALRDLAKFSADINREAQLVSLGYRLTPIEINEAALLVAADVMAREQYTGMGEEAMCADDVDIKSTRAAIVAYLEGAGHSPELGANHNQENQK